MANPAFIMLMIGVWSLIGFGLYVNSHRAPEDDSRTSR
jgi:hypothetical protein